MKKVWMLTHLRLLVLEPMPPGPKDKIGVLQTTSNVKQVVSTTSSQNIVQGAIPKCP